MDDYQISLSLSANIHFVYNLEAGKFIFLDESVSWFFRPDTVTTELIISSIHPDDLPVLRHAYPRVIKGEFNGNLKFRVCHAGEEWWLQVTPFLSRTDDQTIIFGNIDNITSEVENFNSIARYANKKNSVLHMLSHDLRGPLDVANSLVKILDREISDPVTLNKTHSISLLIQEAINLITDLTDREFLDTVEAALVKKRIDIVQKMGEYLEECRLSEEMAGRSFNFSSSGDSVFVELDEAKFMQVVNNLISNALKFTRTGGLITVHIEERPDHVVISFADNGIGIPADMLPVIFDEYTAAKRPGLNGEPTTGLGLSIVKAIVEWHNGKIWCESEEEKGASFMIQLPKLNPN